MDADNTDTDKTKTGLFVIRDDDNHSEIGSKIYCQLYLYRKLQATRLIGFLDSGSDLSIIQESYLKKILSQEEIAESRNTNNAYDLTSFSNTKIQLKYSIPLEMAFQPYKPFGKRFQFTFQVISDIQGAPPLLIGADFMRYVLMNTAYTGQVEDPVPEVRVIKPEQQLVTTFYTTERKAYSCHTTLNMEPYEQRTVKFILHPASPCLTSDHILISGADLENHVYVTPSRSKVFYNEHKKKYYAYAFVLNESPYKNTTKFTTTYEILDGQWIIPVTQENRNKLAAYSLIQDVYPFKYSRNDRCIQLKDSLPEDDEDCVKVSAALYQISKTEEDLKITSPESVPQSEIDKFYQKEHTAICDPEFEDKKDLPYDIAIPHGHMIEDDQFKRRIEDIVDLTKFDKTQRPYIEKIFLKKYSKVLARGVLDAGNLSKTLGYYQLRLKENQVLPKFKKVFFMNPTESQHLKDILSFLLKNNIIIRAPFSGDKGDMHGSPAYLIPKANRNSQGRLIVDYRHLNSLLESEPSIIEDIPTLLHSMRSSAMFSSTDLSNAYYSFQISKDSRYLTQFVCSQGAFQYVSLPTGISTACICFQRVANKMLHEKPVLNEDGTPVYESENMIKTIPDPIPGVICFFDDIVVHTKAYETYEETVRNHYKTVEKVIERLHFHDARVSFEKSSLGKFRITFLGWLISQNFIMVNPKRMIKLQEAEFPQSVKGVRSFLGLLNSLRMALNF